MHALTHIHTHTQYCMRGSAREEKRGSGCRKRRSALQIRTCLIPVFGVICKDYLKTIKALQAKFTYFVSAVRLHAT